MEGKAALVTGATSQALRGGLPAPELAQHITNAEVKKKTEDFYGNITLLGTEDIAAIVIAAAVYAVTKDLFA